MPAFNLVPVAPRISTTSGVVFLDSMGDDLAVADAARVSFDKQSEWENADLQQILAFVQPSQYPEFEEEAGAILVSNPKWEGRLSYADAKLIKYLAANNHWTPFGHCTLKFRIKTSFAMARQLVKHQVGLVWNEVSRRYVQSPMTYFRPEVWRAAADNVKQGSSNKELTYMFDGALIDDRYNEVLEVVDAFYQALLHSGVCPEQARFVLPLCGETEWIWTGSLAAFARVCKLRLDPHAQKEVRDVAAQIDSLVSSNWKFSNSWAALMSRDLPRLKQVGERAIIDHIQV